MNRWSLHVKNFGKIKEATVEVAPMTLFLGDNNSGKSYLMTLIYGLLNINLIFQIYDIEENSLVYQKCCKVIKQNLNQHVQLTSEEYASFVELLNEVLDKIKDKFLQNLFNKKMEIEELHVSFSEKMQYSLEILQSHNINDEEEYISIKIYEGGERNLYGLRMETKRFEEENGIRYFLGYILEFMLKSGFSGMGRGDAAYFPMARTGFLLTYKSLVKSAMQYKFNLQETDKNLLTKPNSDFLSALSRLDTQEPRKKHQKIIEFMESYVIHGHVKRTEFLGNEIFYIPEGQEKQLPMFVVSGVVTEMTPLLLFLQYRELGTLMMEEPEISLHPELQWALARVLIRIYNNDVPVFITTHSDIILQHVNNMLKLEAVENKDAVLQKLGYEPEDLLKREDVAVYQFDVDEKNQTKVTRLPCGDYGFEAMTFYNTLKELNDQIDCIEGTESGEI